MTGDGRSFGEKRSAVAGIRALNAMPQTLDAAHAFGYEARVASGGEGIAGTAKLALKGFQPKLGELHGAREIAGVTFVVYRQLFAGEDDLLWIGDKLVPEARGAIAIAAALGHQS
jgi:hypothetical protein